MLRESGLAACLLHRINYKCLVNMAIQDHVRQAPFKKLNYETKVASILYF
jgi:hypothetical protein